MLRKFEKLKVTMVEQEMRFCTFVIDSLVQQVIHDYSIVRCR